MTPVSRRLLNDFLGPKCRILGAGLQPDGEESILTALGRAGGRDVIAVAGDIRVIGTADAPVTVKKVRHACAMARERGLALVLLVSPDPALGDDLGAAGYGREETADLFVRRRESPWVTAVLGSAHGTAAVHAAMSDFVVAVRPSGGTDGREADQAMEGAEFLPDQVAETSKDALQAVENFLAFLSEPDGELSPVSEGAGGGSAPFDGENVPIRRVIDGLVDADGLFELRPQVGRSVVTGLARIDGAPVGILADDRSADGGVLDADACAKAVRLLILCDSFDLPVVRLVDREGHSGATDSSAVLDAKALATLTSALASTSVPTISVVLGQCHGLPALGAGLVGGTDELAAWSSARISVSADGGQGGAFRLAEMYRVHTVLDPSETRSYLQRTLAAFRMGDGSAPARHLLACWPYF